MFRNYPELYMTDLNVRIMNDLTFNLKKSRGEEFPWLGNNKADKQCQTEPGQPGQGRQEQALGSQHGGSGVKFVFDCEGSSLKSPNLSTKSFTMGNGVERTSKTILKKHTNSIHENMASTNLERSLSLTDSNIPLLDKKQTFEQVSRLSKFRERFSKKKAASEDICSGNLVLDIPEIVLNSPEDDSSVTRSQLY